MSQIPAKDAGRYEIKAKPLGTYADILAENGLLASLPKEAELEKEVRCLSIDSRDVREGTLFICKGLGFKREYAEAASKAGAFCCVAERDYSIPGMPCMVVSDVRKAMALLAKEYYCDPASRFTLIGLTGTKGKSTTLYYIKAIAEEYVKDKGLGPFTYLSTIDTFDGVEFFESHLTTPESVELYKRFSNAASAGAFAMGMEVSSQALKYDRVLGVDFDIASFSNFSPDHIGSTEHPDVEDYFRSKLRIFERCRTAIINLDTDRADEVIAAAKASQSVEKIVFVGSSAEPVCGETPDYYLSGLRKDGGEIAFSVMRGGESPLIYADIRLGMPGLFNAENALIALAIAAELGIDPKTSARALRDARAAGRMETFVNEERGLTVIVDYAHNYLSFEKLLVSLREEYPGQRIEILFGCPGGKGHQRRVDLPKAAARYADYAWITEEDPAFDDPAEISREVLKNLESFGGSGEIIVDRARAVETAIKKAAPGTVLVLAAKGREKYMHRGNDYVPIESDAELAERLV